MFWVANIYFPMLCFVPIKNSVTSLTLKDREKENTSYNPNETTVNTLLNFMQPFCFHVFKIFARIFYYRDLLCTAMIVESIPATL